MQSCDASHTLHTNIQAKHATEIRTFCSSRRYVYVCASVFVIKTNKRRRRRTTNVYFYSYTNMKDIRADAAVATATTVTRSRSDDAASGAKNSTTHRIVLKMHSEWQRWDDVLPVETARAFTICCYRSDTMRTVRENDFFFFRSCWLGDSFHWPCPRIRWDLVCLPESYA